MFCKLDFADDSWAEPVKQIVIYRITSVMKVETYIITDTTESSMGWAVKLVVIYAETFKTDVIEVISNVIMCLMSHWLR
jgi:hypothetical protein